MNSCEFGDEDFEQIRGQFRLRSSISSNLFFRKATKRHEAPAQRTLQKDTPKGQFRDNSLRGIVLRGQFWLRSSISSNLFFRKAAKRHEAPGQKDTLKDNSGTQSAGRHGLAWVGLTCRKPSARPGDPLLRAGSPLHVQDPSPDMTYLPYICYICYICYSIGYSRYKRICS